MRFFRLSVFEIQSVRRLDFDLDLSKSSITCIVGKNGVGKSTLVRAIRNLSSSDTFQRTASPLIFRPDSRINYNVDAVDFDFGFNSKLKTIDSKNIVPDAIKNNIHVELPIPHGERFTHFQSLGGIDKDLRRNILLENFDIPSELIGLLSEVYATDRFTALRVTTIRNRDYYFLSLDNNYYVREDYLSSGEYFLINLFKVIQSRCKLIVIDEIDISLDSSSQVKLIGILRAFCEKYEVNLVFTTHSLALMETLDAKELYYLEKAENGEQLKNISFNYIKSLLFGFRGFDRYILTEDHVLQKYLESLLSRVSSEIFYTFKIIYVGGGANVVDLMKRNTADEFLAKSDHVVCFLDGDQKDKTYCQNIDGLIFSAFSDIEIYFFERFENGLIEIKTDKNFTNPKKFYEHVICSKQMTESAIFEHINDSKADEVSQVLEKLLEFLNQ